MHLNTLKLFIVGALAIFPSVALAQPRNYEALVTIIVRIVEQLTAVVFGLALLYFFWGMAKYIFHAGNEKTREEGRKRMVWGTLAIFFILSWYGLVNWLDRSFINQPSGQVADYQQLRWSTFENPGVYGEDNGKTGADRRAIY